MHIGVTPFRVPITLLLTYLLSPLRLEVAPKDAKPWPVSHKTPPFLEGRKLRIPTIIPTKRGVSRGQHQARNPKLGKSPARHAVREAECAVWGLGNGGDRTKGQTPPSAP